MKSFLSWKKKNFLWKVCRIFWSLLIQTYKKDNSFWHKKIQVFIFNLHFISSVNEVIFSKWSKEICSLQVNDVSPWEHPFYTCNTPLFYKKSVALFSASEKYAALTSTAFSLRWAVQLCAENVRVHNLATTFFGSFFLQLCTLYFVFRCRGTLTFAEQNCRQGRRLCPIRNVPYFYMVRYGYWVKQPVMYHKVCFIYAKYLPKLFCITFLCGAKWILGKTIRNVPQGLFYICEVISQAYLSAIFIVDR